MNPFIVLLKIVDHLGCCEVVATWVECSYHNKLTKNEILKNSNYQGNPEYEVREKRNKSKGKAKIEKTT